MVWIRFGAESGAGQDSDPVCHLKSDPDSGSGLNLTGSALPSVALGDNPGGGGVGEGSVKVKVK
jgi:hypothetical protein